MNDQPITPEPAEAIEPLEPFERRQGHAVHRKSKILLEAIAAGNSNQAACGLAGVSPVTFYGWLRRGRDQQSRKVRGFYRAFLESYEGSSARCEDRLLQAINEAATKQWQAAGWLLERRFPERWSQRVTIAVQTELENAFSRLEKALPPEWLSVALRALAGDESPAELGPSAPPGVGEEPGQPGPGEGSS